MIDVNMSKTLLCTANSSDASPGALQFVSPRSCCRTHHLRVRTTQPRPWNASDLSPTLISKLSVVYSGYLVSQNQTYSVLQRRSIRGCVAILEAILVWLLENRFGFRHSCYADLPLGWNWSHCSHYARHNVSWFFRPAEIFSAYFLPSELFSAEGASQHR